MLFAEKIQVIFQNTLTACSTRVIPVVTSGPASPWRSSPKSWLASTSFNVRPQGPNISPSIRDLQQLVFYSSSKRTDTRKITPDLLQHQSSISRSFSVTHEHVITDNKSHVCSLAADRKSPSQGPEPSQCFCQGKEADAVGRGSSAKSGRSKGRNCLLGQRCLSEDIQSSA